MELLVFLGLGYFLPTIIACTRKPDAKVNIIALSLLLGWLPMVSIICIIWALCARTTSKQLDQVNLIAAAMVAAQNGQILTAAPVFPGRPKHSPKFGTGSRRWGSSRRSQSRSPKTGQMTTPAAWTTLPSGTPEFKRPSNRRAFFQGDHA